MHTHCTASAAVYLSDVATDRVMQFCTSSALCSIVVNSPKFSRCMLLLVFVFCSCSTWILPPDVANLWLKECLCVFVSMPLCWASSRGKLRAWIGLSLCALGLHRPWGVVLGSIQVCNNTILGFLSKFPKITAANFRTRSDARRGQNKPWRFVAPGEIAQRKPWAQICVWFMIWLTDVVWWSLKTTWLRKCHGQRISWWLWSVETKRR